MPPDDDDPPSGDDPKGPPLAPEVVRAFLASPQARQIATNVIKAVVPGQEVEQLAGDALTKALVAPAPSKKEGLVGWLAVIARRTAIDWLRKDARRKPYRGDMPAQVAGEDAYTGEAHDSVEPGELAYDPDADDEPHDLLGRYLDKLIGDDARDREVRGWIRDKAEHDKTYAAIAEESGITEAQVAQRIHRFKLKYGPRVKKRRRTLMMLWIGAGVTFVIAVAIALVLHARRAPEKIDRDPAALPLPSATATASGFPQALPTQPSSSAPSEFEPGPPGDKLPKRNQK